MWPLMLLPGPRSPSTSQQKPKKQKRPRQSRPQPRRLMWRPLPPSLVTQNLPSEQRPSEYPGSPYCYWFQLGFCLCDSFAAFLHKVFQYFFSILHMLRRIQLIFMLSSLVKKYLFFLWSDGQIQTRTELGAAPKKKNQPNKQQNDETMRTYKNMAAKTPTKESKPNPHKKNPHSIAVGGATDSMETLWLIVMGSYSYTAMPKTQLLRFFPTMLCFPGQSSALTSFPEK